MSNSAIKLEEARSLPNICEIPGNSRIAPENGIAESRALDHQDGLERLLDVQEFCDYKGMMACAH